MSKKNGFFSKSLIRRQSKGLPQRKKILIVCEGEKTEPQYFRGFKLPAVEIESGSGLNNETLVEFSIEKKKNAKKEGKEFDDVWCVFDKDSFPKQNINSAIANAKKNQIRLAISNECFELWYLLHFDFVNDGRSRKDYIESLNEKLKPVKYKKQSLYPILKDKVDVAIHNAKNLTSQHGITVKESCLTLLERYPGLNFCDAKPFTSVHDLVSELLSETKKIGGKLG